VSKKVKGEGKKKDTEKWPLRPYFFLHPFVIGRGIVDELTILGEA